MAYIIIGTMRADGLLPIEFLGNLEYEEVLQTAPQNYPDKESVIMEEIYVIPTAPSGTGYEVLVDPVKKEYVYEPYEVPQEGPQEETVAKLREELVAANERLEALTEQVAALTNRMGVE